jgi:lipid-binding SYLF domain-containing protein
MSLGRALWAGAVLSLSAATATWADNYSDAIQNFKGAGASAHFFHSCYAYAVFPNVGEGAFIVGGEGGKGKVYLANGQLLGTSIMGGLTLGFQAGGQVYSEIIFFQDKRALEEFQTGRFEFGAGASATAITAGLSASAATNGSQASASGSVQNAATAGAYQRGTAIFTVAKGGLMYAANIAGQKFSYKAGQD